MNSSYDAVKPPIFQALEVLHDVANAVSGIVPGATEALVLAEAGAHGVPSAQGLFWQPRSDLPVQDDGFDTLCGKAGKDAASLVTAPLHRATGVDLGLDGPAGDFTSSLSSWFCGDSGDAPPEPKEENVQTSFPQTDKGRLCAADTTPVDPKDPTAATPLCAAHRLEMTAGAPDGKTGACPSTGDCAANGAYETLAAAALEQCDPLGSPRPSKYFYQQRKAKVSYQWTRAGWKRLEPTYIALTNENSTQPPCGPKQARPSVAVGYNRDVHPHGEVSEVVPVCTNEVVPSSPGRPLLLGATVEVPFLEVVHILGCIKSIEQKGQVKGITTAKSDSGGSKSPKMVLSDAALGDQNFQLRTLVTADVPADEAERIMHVTLWGAPEPASELAGERALGNLGVAQAEYFYDAADGRGEWMWNMNWRARLTRFRLPSGEGVMAGCQGLCPALVSRLAKYDSLFVH
jgi:hypothetical protein